MTEVTCRVRGVFKPSDFPRVPDEATKKDLERLFQSLFAGSAVREIDGSHGGLAVLAQNPRLALHVSTISRYIVTEMPWSVAHRDMLELAIQTVNWRFGCDYAFQARMKNTVRGLPLELQALIPLWRSTNAFNDEQKLVIEYAVSLVDGEVSDAVFQRVMDSYGEMGAIELTVAIGWFSFWAMIIDATRLEFDFGYGRSREPA